MNPKFGPAPPNEYNVELKTCPYGRSLSRVPPRMVHFFLKCELLAHILKYFDFPNLHSERFQYIIFAATRIPLRMSSRGGKCVREGVVIMRRIPGITYFGVEDNYQPISSILMRLPSIDII